MAAPKKKPATRTASKTVTTRKPTKKAKPAPRKAAARTASNKATPSMQSFKLAQPQTPFISLKITIQTLYWLILAGAVLLLGLWVLNINNKVQSIYDEIDASAALQAELDAKELQALREKIKKQQ